MDDKFPPVMTADVLRSVPLFETLDERPLDALKELLEVRTYPGGTPLFRAGDQGDAMYLIADGQVQISVPDADGKSLVLAELARGDFFGELAILDGMPRSADAMVITDAHLAVLSRVDFLSFVEHHPEVSLKMLSAIAMRLRETDNLLRQRVSRNANVEEAKRLTLADRMADLIAEFGGSWKFIGAVVAAFVLWVAINTLMLRNAGFDPYPYVLLNLVLGVVTGLQAPIIMMSQNRQGEKDRLRADLDYQVNLKNELALTEVLRRLDVLESERLPMLFDEQQTELARRLAAAGEAPPQLT